MDRRAYLGTVVSGVGLFGGCVSGGGDAEPTTPGSTPTPTATATEPQPSPSTEIETPRTGTETAGTETETVTETEGPDPLRIEHANLLWSGGGDDPVVQNRIESAGVGTSPWFGTRVRFDFDDADPFEPHVRIRIFDADGRQVDTVTHAFDRVDEPPESWTSYWMRLDTTGYTKGRFEGEVTITDRVRDVTSEPASFEFELVDPLSSAEVELRDHEPARVTTGDPFGWELTFRNLSDRTSGLEGTLLLELADEGTQRVVGSRTWTLPARSTVTFRRDGFTFETPDTYVFTLQPHDVSWEIEATEAAEATAKTDSSRPGRTV